MRFCKNIFQEMLMRMAGIRSENFVLSRNAPTFDSNCFRTYCRRPTFSDIDYAYHGLRYRGEDVLLTPTLTLPPYCHHLSSTTLQNHVL